MSKLHEVIAVEGDLKGAAEKILDETVKVFKDKPALFLGRHRTLVITRDKVEDDTPDEHDEITTTVNERLDYTWKHLIRYYDLLIQKESTNQEAKGNIIIDGKAIATDVPATMLLGLETRLRMLRRAYDAIPTLATGRKWEKDTQKGKDIYVTAVPDKKVKTHKEFKSTILVPPSFPKEGEGGQSLPAQIEKWEENIPIGYYEETVWSSMLTAKEKSDLIGRLDTLIQAVKQARMRANNIDVHKVSIGKALFNFVHGS